MLERFVWTESSSFMSLPMVSGELLPFKGKRKKINHWFTHNFINYYQFSKMAKQYSIHVVRYKFWGKHVWKCIFINILLNASYFLSFWQQHNIKDKTQHIFNHFAKSLTLSHPCNVKIFTSQFQNHFSCMTFSISIYCLNGKYFL